MTRAFPPPSVPVLKAAETVAPLGSLRSGIGAIGSTLVRLGSVGRGTGGAGGVGGGGPFGLGTVKMSIAGG
jgi:hypothetical protein